MISQEIIKNFKEQKLKFVLFSGSWCATCMMYLPKIMKIISQFDLGKDEVEIHEVGIGKREPAEFIQKHDIIFIPTLIIYRGDKELGRIIEHPKKSWEEDIADIIGN
jgi:thiol-disulfide isomerase/thioredoxin